TCRVLYAAAAIEPALSDVDSARRRRPRAGARTTRRARPPYRPEGTAVQHAHARGANRRHTFARAHARAGIFAIRRLCYGARDDRALRRARLRGSATLARDRYSHGVGRRAGTSDRRRRARRAPHGRGWIAARRAALVRRFALDSGLAVRAETGRSDHLRRDHYRAFLRSPPP